MKRALAGALLLVAAGATPADAPRLSLEDLRTRLNRAIGIASAGERSPGQDTMRRLRRQLGFPVVVELPGGSLSLDEDPLIGALDGDEALDFAAARSRVEAIAEEVERASALERADHAGIERRLQDAYQGVETGISVRERIREWLAARFGRILRALAGDEGALSVVAWLVVLLAAGGLAWVLVRAGGRPRRERVARERAVRLEAPDWKALADGAAAAGDYATAVRYEYLRLLDVLADREIVAADESLTAGECRRAVRRRAGTLASRVDEASDAFERTAYAHRETGEAEFETVRRAVDAAIAYPNLATEGAAA